MSKAKELVEKYAVDEKDYEAGTKLPVEDLKIGDRVLDKKGKEVKGYKAITGGYIIDRGKDVEVVVDSVTNGLVRAKYSKADVLFIAKTIKSNFK